MGKNEIQRIPNTEEKNEQIQLVEGTKIMERGKNVIEINQQETKKK